MAKAVPANTEDPNTKRLRTQATQLTASRRHDLAEPIWRELLTTLPRDPGLHRRLAYCLLNLRRLDEGFAEAQTAVTLNPASYESLTMLGLMHRMLGRYVEAIVAHSQALEFKPDFLPAILGMALDHIVQLHWPEALEWANRGLAIRPGYIDLLRVRGKALAVTGQHDEARVVMEEFLRRAPDAAESHHAAAIILRRLGRTAEAVEFAERNLAMNPADPESHNYIASLKVDARQFDEADRFYQNAADIRDSRREGQKGSVAAEINTLLGQAAVNLNKRRFTLAESQYRRVLEIKPEHHVAKALQAGAIGAQNRFEEAFALAREAVGADPLGDIPRRILAALLYETEQFAEAATLVNSGLERQPNSSEWLIVQSGLYIRQDKFTEAVVAAEAAMAAKPSTRVKRVLAVALAGAGRRGEAVEAIESALAEESGTVVSEAEAGYVFHLLGDQARAEAHLLKAMSLDESGLVGHGALGLIYAAQERTDEARAMLMKSLELNPHQWQIRKALDSLDMNLAEFTTPDRWDK